MTEYTTLGQCLEKELAQALNVFTAGPVLADHTRHLLWGVNSRGDVLNRSLDDALAEATNVLVESGKVYRYGNSVVFEEGCGETGSLMALALDSRAEIHAAANLTNLLAVTTGNSEFFTQASVPPRFAASLLASQSLRDVLPEIRLYSRRPVFDEDFGWNGPGYHESPGLLIHGPDIAPVPYKPELQFGARALDRLPPRLAQLLGEFAWRSDADLVNAVAAFLTGFLYNHFVDEPHPIVLLDGNQSGIGKTLLAQCLGRVLDGIEPARISLAGEEELEKKLGAHIWGSRTSLIFLDNVRERMVSSVIEQNALSPLLRFRILGTSAFIEQPNSYIWVITSNLTTAASDVVTRALPIRLSVEGDPKKRNFTGRPLAYACDHRLEILGELAGMVHYWLLKGKPQGTHRHRCERWASVIAGVLEECGLGQYFLANLDDVAVEMDENLNQLGTLADYVWRNHHEKLIYRPTTVCDEPDSADTGSPGGKKDPAGVLKEPSELGLPAGEWVPILARAGILADKLASGASRSKATVAGQFLSNMIDRPVTVEGGSEELTCVLRKRLVRSNKSLFFFEVRSQKSSPLSPVEEISDNCDPALSASGQPVGPDENLQGTLAPSGTPADEELKWY